jgi:transposase-like protein
MDVDREVRRIAKLGSWSDSDGKRIADAWRRSGQSRAAFGRRYGIAVHRLYFWVAKFGGKSVAAPPRKGVRFHPVRVTGDDSLSRESIEIRLVKVPRGIGEDELRVVLSALRG